MIKTASTPIYELNTKPFKTIKPPRRSARDNRPNVTVLTRKIRRQMLKDIIGSNRIAKTWKEQNRA